MMWFAKPSSFNDPFDCNLSETNKYEENDITSYLQSLGLQPDDYESDMIRKSVMDSRKNVLEKKGILSLSCTVDNIRMWSHYAEKHTGAVLAFDVLNDIDYFLMPINIKYQDTYTETNFLHDQKKATMDNISVKAGLWGYEKEFRVMNPESKNWPFNAEALTEIYFGCNSDDTLVEKVISSCSSNGLTHVIFYKAIPKHGEFGLDFTRITN